MSTLQSFLIVYTHVGKAHNVKLIDDIEFGGVKTVALDIIYAEETKLKRICIANH